MNGERPGDVGGEEGHEIELQDLQRALQTTHVEIARLRELQQRLDAERQAALRDAVIRTRETIQDLERQHAAALTRLEEETESELRRLRAQVAEARRSH